VTLVAPFATHHYSGMVPGYLQGTYAEPDLAFDLRRLCERARARFVEAFAEGIDPAGRTVAAGGERHAFDLLSLDVGSAAAGLDVPGVTAHAYTVRPMSRVVALRRRADEVVGSAAARGGAVRACVVGGGAGGVEVALALHRRIGAGGGRPEVTLVEAGPGILADYAPRARGRAVRVLARRGVTVRTGQPVVRVEADGVELGSGLRLLSDLTVWLTGAAAPAVIAASPLPRDARGFLLVDATLRAVDGAPVWGAGDCVTLAEHPGTPRAGVYAVREAPVLEANLRATLTGAPVRRYTPQPAFLALLNTADGKALLRWPWEQGLSGDMDLHLLPA
jgi:selenide,water dikinase